MSIGRGLDRGAIVHEAVREQWLIQRDRLERSPLPILVGPWRSEVGFEILYWLPFLHHAMKSGIDPSRMIAIGRGGSAHWYGTGGTADLYEFVPVETVRQWSILASQQTGSIKQQSEESWEPHVVALTAASLGLKEYQVLSPSWMYRLLSPFWEGKESLQWLDQHTLQPVRFPAPAIDAALQLQLPKDFIAMRWYVRPTWPHKEQLLLWMRKLVERVAQSSPVVLIDSFHADDHADVNLGPIPNTHRLSDLTTQTPLNNLQIQSSVIARAKAYVGTYGGMSQLAMRFGVPTLALYDTFEQTAHAHLQLTQYLSLKTGVPFLACTPKEVDGVLPMLWGK